MKYGNIILASHAVLINGRFNVLSGPTVPLMEYFLPKCKRFFLIGQPPPSSEGSLMPFLFIYESGTLKKVLYNKWLYWLYNIAEDKRKEFTSMRLKLRDLFSVLYFFIRIRKEIKGEQIDYFIGVESVNAVAGGFSRSFLPVRCCVYYTFDWSIKWFHSEFLNFFYIQLDKWACRLSEFTWNTSNRIGEARRKVLKYNKKMLRSELTVPHGIMSFRESLVKERLASPFDTVVFCGALNRENGGLMLPAIARHMNEMDRAVKMIVVGGGATFDRIQKEIDEQGLLNIELKGNLNDQSEIDNILVASHLGIAPYVNLKYSRKYFGDVIKIRHYFACGLPVVTTSIPPISDEISKENLRVVAPEDPKEIARQCVSLLRDKKRYINVRRNVIKKAKKYHCSEIYEKTFERMELERGGGHCGSSIGEE